MSTGSSIKALPKYVQVFLEINIRPNWTLIVAANCASERKRSFVSDISSQGITSSESLFHFASIYLISVPLFLFFFLNPNKRIYLIHVPYSSLHSLRPLKLVSSESILSEGLTVGLHRSGLSSIILRLSVFSPTHSICSRRIRLQRS